MISWFEIPAFDFDKAVEFYSKVFDIQIEIKSFGSGPYAVMNDKRSGIAGALIPVKEKLAPNMGPILFFKVLDMSETIRRIKLLHGEILKEKSLIRNETAEGKIIIPKTLIDNSSGYFAVFRDPDGNKMALYSNS
jgi:predicted enzyme related to lactoylglutathione lyase